MFQLPHIPLSEELIDTSFRSARKAARTERGKGKKHTSENRKLNGEIQRVKVIGSIISGNLTGIVEGFPSFDQLSAFQQNLFLAQIDLDRYRKSLARLQGVAKVVNEEKSKVIPDLKKRGNLDVTKKFMGKVSSMVKKLNKELEWLVEVKLILLSFPVVKEDYTIVIAGFPNVGKSTFLRTLTDSKVKVAAYPFTTQNLLFGYRKKRYIEYQLIDTPGILDRPLSERNVIELKAISAIEHLGHVILYIFDETQEIKSQEHLFKELKKEFKIPVITAVNEREIDVERYPVSTRLRKKSIIFNAMLEGDCLRVFDECVEKIKELV